MAWHVEGQNTPITVCVGKRERKGFLRVSVVEKAQSKPKHQNNTFSPFSFLPNTMSYPFNFSPTSHYKKTKMERETREQEWL